MTGHILHGDNLCALKKIPDQSIDLIYIDPPFNTGKSRKLIKLKCRASDSGNRIGFGDKKYITQKKTTMSYNDSHQEYNSFIRDRTLELYRILKQNGSLFFHIDWRESHKMRLLLDNIFGENHMMNEIIWAYDWGARSKNKWSSKHDSIYWYTKNKKDYTFNYDNIDRIPYLAPSLVGEKKAKRGKTPTDVWRMTIEGTNSKERTGYPTQKPLRLLERIIKVHSNPNDIVLDCFAGSGTTGRAAMLHNRNFIMIDDNDDSISVMRKRLNEGELYITNVNDITWSGIEVTTLVKNSEDLPDIFIGPGSMWANPFSINKDGSENDVAEKFRLWLLTSEQAGWIRDNIDRLKDKKLWCPCNSNYCHGKILISYLERNL